MHNLHSRILVFGNFTGTRARDAAGEFRPIEIANPHDVSSHKGALTTRYAGRQKAPAIFAQRFLRAVIDKERTFGPMKKRDPALAALELLRLRNKERPLF